MISSAIRYQLSRVVGRLAPLFPDVPYLHLFYYLHMGKRLDLSNPKTFSEKLQWLKIHYRQDKLTMLVDKLAVKPFVARLIGEDMVCPVLAVWDRVEDIDLSKLPDRFVLKTTHSGGNTGVVVCKSKRDFDFDEAKKKLEEAMRTNVYTRYREWPYKNIPKKIFAEKNLGDNLVDYKFYCFNGEADCVLVCTGRQQGDVKYFFLDRDWNFLPYNEDSIKAQDQFHLKKPDELEQLFSLAEKMSKGFPFVRMDFFIAEGKVFFSEYTFFPASGLDAKKTEEFERKAGGKIDLSLVKP
ncbi:MAG: glycosyl transferase [Prevotella sp.]|nr:glycosyl transferase [Prevotella sp.]